MIQVIFFTRIAIDADGGNDAMGLEYYAIFESQDVLRESDQ